MARLPARPSPAALAVASRARRLPQRRFAHAQHLHRRPAEARNRERLTADEAADLGALHVRLGAPQKALGVLRDASPPSIRSTSPRRQPRHGLAPRRRPERRAREALDDAVRLAPAKWKQAEDSPPQAGATPPARRKRKTNSTRLAGSRSRDGSATRPLAARRWPPALATRRTRPRQRRRPHRRQHPRRLCQRTRHEERPRCGSTARQYREAADALEKTNQHEKPDESKFKSAAAARPALRRRNSCRRSTRKASTPCPGSPSPRRRSPARSSRSS